MPCVLSFQVQPRAGRTEIVGWHGDAIKIRIKAPPVEGAANDELERFLSKTVGVARTAIEIVSGSRGKRKRVKIDGMNQEEVLGILGL